MRVNAGIWPLGVDIGADAGFEAEAVGNRIFDFERCKIERLQRAVLRGDLDFEAFFGGEPNLPGHIAGGFVQILLVAVLAHMQLHQHALAQAAVEVQAAWRRAMRSANSRHRASRAGRRPANR